MNKSAKDRMSSIAIKVYARICKWLTNYKFRSSNVKVGNFHTLGRPFVEVHAQGYCSIGDHLRMVNVARFATLGKSNRCKILVNADATLTIGDKVAMSNATIVATKRVTIGQNVMIGGGVTIVDSDFHSLNPAHWHTDQDVKHMVSEPVTIGDDVFLGMNSIVLKGVTIGNGAVIAAGAVVANDVPCGQIWGGNPAKFIRMRVAAEEPAIS